MFEADDAERYIRDYEIEAFNEMLNGSVLIGFTEEMVKDTWEKPDSINRAFTETNGSMEVNIYILKMENWNHSIKSL